MIYPGIDLGTTYSLIAHVNPHGHPALIPDALDANQFRTPSVVYIGHEGTLVGQPVEDLLEDTPELPVARFVKAQLASATWRYRDSKKRAWRAEGLSALILKKLLSDAGTFVADDLGPAVLTVPAYFNDLQRKATLQAAQLAGLPQVRLFEEPVAAATYYGVDEGPADRSLLVYDFGGGTFDVTVLQTSAKGLYVLATDGIGDLGGRHIDEAIMQLADTAYRSMYGSSALVDPGVSQRLRKLSEQAKIKLAQPSLGHFKHSLLLQGRPFDFLITRPQFEKICDTAIERTLAACGRCLDAANLKWQDVDKILLAGGSSLLPNVTRALLTASGKQSRDIVTRGPHQAVAYGAAILAQRRCTDETETSVHQVAGYDLCLRVWDRERKQPGLERLIARNTTLPATYTRVFYTNREDQTRLVLEFLQRRGDPVREVSLGNFSFGPIRNPKRNYPVEVTSSIGTDGLIQVHAKDHISGTLLSQTLDTEGKAVLDQGENEFEMVRASRINM